MAFVSPCARNLHCWSNDVAAVEELHTAAQSDLFLCLNDKKTVKGIDDSMCCH